jgi:hypothetical protein
MAEKEGPFEGGCTCGYVRYRVTSRPLIVHCCHCSKCQVQSGAAFAINALVEADRVEVTSGEVSEVLVATPSNKNQRIARCPRCQVALWSNYLVLAGVLGEYVRFVKVGTLDDPAAMPPDVHIYAAAKQPWLELPPGSRVYDEYYDTKEIWSEASLERRDALFALAKQ